MSEMICIACPVGCRLTTRSLEDGTIEVTGNRCPRGEAYGREEALSPKRVLTATVPTNSSAFPCAPVRTEGAIERSRIPELLTSLYALRVELPVTIGQTCLESFHGVRVLFTRTLPPDEVPPVGEAGAEAKGEDQVS